MKNWKRYLPVFRGTMEDAIEKEREAHKRRSLMLHDEFHKTLKKTTEAVDEIVQRSVRTIYANDFDPRENPFGTRYELRVRFEPSLVRGLRREAQEVLADAVARKVRHEVARAKFVEETR